MNPFQQRRIESLDRRSSALDVADTVASIDGHVIDKSELAQQLESLAQRLSERLTDRQGSQAQAQAMLDTLFEDAGLRGATESFYQPENSYLDVVIRRGRGIPISLALAYIEVGRRAGLRVDGINFPGHFLVVVRDHDDDRAGVLIDPFVGTLLSRSDCAERLRVLFGERAQLQPEHLMVASAADIAVRMFGNLKAIRVHEDEWDRALELSNAILALAPQRVDERADRAIILQKMDCFDAAIADLVIVREHAADDDVRAQIDARLAELRARNKPIRH